MKGVTNMRSIIALIAGVFVALALPNSAMAQSYGGIKKFTVDFPIQTYEQPEEGKRLQPAGKLLRKNDVGRISDILIIAVYGLNGNGYVEIETPTGHYWVRRGHVDPLRASLVDKQIDESNGKVGCPPGTTLVAQGGNSSDQSGVARNLGGVSIFCKQIN